MKRCKIIKACLVFTAFILSMVCFLLNKNSAYAGTMDMQDGVISWTSSGVAADGGNIYYTYGYDFTVVKDGKNIGTVPFWDNEFNQVEEGPDENNIKTTYYSIDLSYVNQWYGESLYTGDVFIIANPYIRIESDGEVLRDNLRSVNEVAQAFYDYWGVWYEIDESDFNIKVNWSSYYLNVEYDSGVASVSNGNHWYDYGEVVWLTYNIKDGYEFDYAEDLDNGNKYGANPDTWTMSGSRHVYVHSKQSQHYINVEYDSGIESVSGANQYYNAIDTARLTANPKTGYHFTYVKDLDNGISYNENPSTWSMRQDRRVYIYSAANDYSITFNRNGGNLKESSVTVTYDSDKNWSREAQRPDRQGYDFSGWYTSPAGGICVYDANAHANNNSQYWSNNLWKGTESITVYARWEIRADIGYTVNYWQQNVNGITGQHNNGNYTLKESKAYRGAAGEDTPAQRMKYVGFRMPEQQSVVVKADGSSIVNYYYDRIEYTVHFDTEGGSDGPEDIVLRYGQSAQISDTPTRTGYYFKYWNTSSDETGIVIISSEMLKNMTTTDGETITLYAIWTQKKFQIVKISNSWHGGTFIKRTPGDDEWYNTVGKIKIEEEIPERYIIQKWTICEDGSITRVK